MSLCIKGVVLVSLGAKKFVDGFGETHGPTAVFGGVLVLLLLLLQHRRAPLGLQHGAFGVRGPRDGGVGQSLVQSAVPEQGVVEDPVHPVPQGRDRRVLPVVQAGHGRGSGGGRGEGGGRRLAPQHAGRVLSLVQGRGGLGQGPDPGFAVQYLLLLVVTRLGLLPAVRLEVLRARLETAFAQVLLPPERNGDGEFQRRVLEEVLGGAVGRRGHVRVHEVSVLQLALGALRLQRFEVVQVAQLQILISPTPGLWEEEEGADV